MTDSTVLVATDFSAPADLALEAGIQWAKHAGAELRLLHVFDTWKDSVSDAYQQLGERAARVRIHGVDCVGELIDHGAAPPAGSDLPTEEADWVFVGTQGRSGLRRLAVGSWAESVIRSSACPVVAVGDGSRVSEELSTIVVGMDLSPQSLLVCEQLRAVGKRLGCRRLVLVFARPGPVDMVDRYRDQGMPLPPPDLRDVADDLDTQIAKCRADGYEAHLVSGCEGAADLILQTAEREGAGLIGVGTHSRRGFPHLMFGSVAEEVVRSAAVPVYTTRSATRKAQDE